jgi:uncharacterized protein (TIGR03435 family)
MPRRLLTVLCITAAAFAAARAQQPAFEVASVKRNVSGDIRSGSRTLPGGRVNITNQRLRQVIRSAYGASDIEVIGGPDWLDTERWDIVAVGGTDDRDAKWWLMLRSLLTDRFKLVAHVEQRERPVYGLVFARNDRVLGPNIHPTTCTGQDVCTNTSANTSGITSGTIVGTSRTLEDIGSTLSAYVERRVLDRTGLEARYDFELKWSEEVSIFTAVREQLGLTLDAQRAPVDVVVVETVERATED